MLRRAAGAIGNDHNRMRVKIKLHLKSRRKNVNQKKVNIDGTKLKDAKLLQAFAPKGDAISIDQRYNLVVA